MCRTKETIFFFNDTATTEIYTLSLHDALPISDSTFFQIFSFRLLQGNPAKALTDPNTDRKSTRLNSSHTAISYAVYCLKIKAIAGAVSILPELSVGIVRRSHEVDGLYIHSNST